MVARRQCVQRENEELETNFVNAPTAHSTGTRGDQVNRSPQEETVHPKRRQFGSLIRSFYLVMVMQAPRLVVGFEPQGHPV